MTRVWAKLRFEQRAQQPSGMECAPVGAELQLAAPWSAGRVWSERGGSLGGTDQRITIPPFDAVTGVPALITLPSSRLPEVGPSVMRAAMPMPATTVEQISAATTILRWVVRSAVKIEALFMTLSRTPKLFQL